MYVIMYIACRKYKKWYIFVRNIFGVFYCSMDTSGITRVGSCICVTPGACCCCVRQDHVPVCITRAENDMVCVDIEIDLVVMWVAKIDLISVWRVGIDSISV